MLSWVTLHQMLQEAGVMSLIRTTDSRNSLILCENSWPAYDCVECRPNQNRALSGNLGRDFSSGRLYFRYNLPLALPLATIKNMENSASHIVHHIHISTF